jgi:hypothetical protein
MKTIGQGGNSFSYNNMFHVDSDNITTGDAELSIETAERLSETWQRKRRY